jgi:hypothetical protein
MRNITIASAINMGALFHQAQREAGHCNAHGDRPRQGRGFEEEERLKGGSINRRTPISLAGEEGKESPAKKRGFFGRHMHGVGHSPCPHNAEPGLGFTMRRPRFPHVFGPLRLLGNFYALIGCKRKPRRSGASWSRKRRVSWRDRPVRHQRGSSPEERRPSAPAAF